MAMADMKLTAEQRRHEAMCAPGSVDAPDYPWGLRIHLEGPQLKALELGLLKPGSRVAVMAVAEVKSASVDDGEGGVRQSMSLQIVEMQATPETPAKRPEDALYPTMAGE